MKFVIDSSFLIALYKTSDVNHQDAKYNIYSMEEGDSLILPLISIGEFLIYSGDISESINYCKQISSSFETITETDLNHFEKITQSKRRTLKANDCLIIAICKRKKAKLLTYDKKLERMCNSVFAKGH